jgi:hypothetical protein
MSIDIAKRNKYMREYYKKRRGTLIISFGGKCSKEGCSRKRKLEFAHIKDTALNGEGRGKWSRYYDALRNPECYTLFCRKHHLEFDRKRREMLRKIRDESS